MAAVNKALLGDIFVRIVNSQGGVKKVYNILVLSESFPGMKGLVISSLLGAAKEMYLL